MKKEHLKNIQNKITKIDEENKIKFNIENAQQMIYDEIPKLLFNDEINISYTIEKINTKEYLVSMKFGSMGVMPIDPVLINDKNLSKKLEKDGFKFNPKIEKVYTIENINLTREELKAIVYNNVNNPDLFNSKFRQNFINILEKIDKIEKEELMDKNNKRVKEITYNIIANNLRSDGIDIKYFMKSDIKSKGPKYICSIERGVNIIPFFPHSLIDYEKLKEDFANDGFDMKISKIEKIKKFDTINYESNISLTLEELKEIISNLKGPQKRKSK